ncbi:MAG: FAD-binding oxidoreductase [Bacteroidetes bacterium]|nr:FAD-binding oxidoreductase [Bacteroidota bacterium]
MVYFSSYWESSILLRKFDFIVLGAGLIGKQIAIKIKSKYPKSRIALVDRSPISYGASTRNAGFACFGSVSEILDDFKRSPQSVVADLAFKRFKGIVQLVDEFGADQIGYRNTGSYEIYTDALEYEDALNNFESINQMLSDVAGIESAFNWKDISSMGMKCMPQALFNPYEGMLNSGMLNEVVSDKAHQLGIVPLYGMDIQQIQSIGNAYQLIDSNGMSLSCHQLIVATNAFTKLLLPELDIIPARGQIILTKPLENLPFDGIFHSDKGYIYFRNIDNRILLGGARNHFEEQEQTFEFKGEDNIKEYLIRYLSEVVLPGQKFEIETSWTGIMAMGKEKIPIVKRVNDNLILCVRMSGMGVALGPVLSDEVLQML